MKGLQLLPASWDPRLPRGTGLWEATGRHFHPLPQLIPHVQDAHPRSYRAVQSLRSAHYQPASAKPRGGEEALQPSPAWTPGLQSCKIRCFCHVQPLGSKASVAHLQTEHEGKFGLHQPVRVRIRLDPLSPSFPFIGDSI